MTSASQLVETAEDLWACDIRVDQLVTNNWRFLNCVVMNKAANFSRPSRGSQNSRI